MDSARSRNSMPDRWWFPAGREHARGHPAAETGPHRADLPESRVGQERVGQERVGQERVGQERGGPLCLGQERVGQGRDGPLGVGQERVGQERVGQERGPLGLGQERVGLERVARERAGQEHVAHERVGQEHVARERVGQEDVAREREARERSDEERVARERVGREREAREREAGERVGRGRERRRDGRGRADRWRFVVVPAGVAAGVAGVVWLVQRQTFGALPAAYWLMVVLAVVVDARPYVVAGRRASSVILPSICFTFAITLAWGIGPALVAQLVSVTVAGARMREPARRTLHLAAQHVVALGGAALVAHLAGLRLDESPGWPDALLTVPAAAGWIAARYALAAPIFEARAPKRAPRWGAELLATAALLLLGPVVLTAAHTGLALVPLVLPALHAVHRMVRSAGEHERASRMDTLTGLPNRRVLPAALAEARGRTVALLLLDLDRFRNVNDALGHPYGDRVLVEVAHRLSAAVPGHDLVVRLGGDEFAVLATRVDGPVAARRIAAHLAEALNRPFLLDGLPIDVSASIGIALRTERESDAAALLRQAETAMYDAKHRGDQIAVYGPDAAHHSPDRLSLLADLHAALRAGPGHDGVTVYYQPQIAIGTGEVVGVEALLRWQHPERGPVGPEELIRVAEPTPVMRLLTGRVLTEVVGQLARWRDAGRPVRAAVNVSARDLHAGDIAERIDELLRAYGLAPELLQLEITESALMADPPRVLNTIARLDRMGVAISLDDFGTGYSSLQHLRRLPLAEVKIDRSFVLGMATDAGDAAIVRSVIDLGDALRLRVVAEGVEDERTWRLLAAAGCHAAQGWFHARPMPAAGLEEWLARYRPLRLVAT